MHPLEPAFLTQEAVARVSRAAEEAAEAGGEGGEEDEAAVASLPPTLFLQDLEDLTTVGGTEPARWMRPLLPFVGGRVRLAVRMNFVPSSKTQRRNQILFHGP